MQLFRFCAFVFAGILVGEVLGRRGGKSKSRVNLCSGAGAMCSKEDNTVLCNCPSQPRDPISWADSTTCKQLKGGEFYCQLNEDIKGGHKCDDRRGNCREGMTCTDLGGDHDHVNICKGICPNPGDMCTHKKFGAICPTGSCPATTTCRLWKEGGHSYCQKTIPIAVNENCADRIGKCAEGLTCKARRRPSGAGDGRACSSISG